MLMGLLLAGCGERQPFRQDIMAKDASPASGCPGIFVLAPVNYMRYMDDEEPVLLASEGRPEDLSVYCTRGEALADLERLTASGELAPGLWRLYRLKGVWEKDVVEVEPGCRRMRRPAELNPFPEHLAALAPERDGANARK